MSLITLILNLLAAGLLLQLAIKYVPMNKTIEKILIIAVVVTVVVWLLQAFGLMDVVNAIKVMPIK